MRTEDFCVHVLGGEWTQRHRGVAADAIQGRARGQEAVQWCRLHGLPQSSRHSIREFTEERAAILARAWCSKMQHFINLRPERDVRTMWTADERRSWAEPSEFTRLAESAAQASKLAGRVLAIRRLFVE